MTPDGKTTETSVDSKVNELNQIAATYESAMKALRFKLQSKLTSKKSLARIVDDFLSFPLERDYPKYTKKEEQELFALLLQIDRTKGIIIKAALQAHNENKEKESEKNG